MGASWLDSLFDKIAFLWPMIRVDSWEEALRITYVPGYPKLALWHPKLYTWVPPRVIETVLKQGMHRCIPWIERINEMPTVQDGLPISELTLTTKDGRSVTIKAVILYRIFNVRKAITNVQQFTETMIQIIEIYLSRQARQSSWNELFTGLDTLEAACVEELNKHSRRFGVKILEVGITNVAKTDNYRHYGNLFRS